MVHDAKSIEDMALIPHGVPSERFDQRRYSIRTLDGTCCVSGNGAVADLDRAVCGSPTDSADCGRALRKQTSDVRAIAHLGIGFCVLTSM
jgi:hypothetical protein